MADIGPPVRLLIILNDDNSTKFLAQLDKHSTKLLQVIRSRGGVVKQKTTGILQVLDETVDITIRRECILKSLMIYLGEPVDHLIKEFQEAETEELEQATMAIFVIGKEDQFLRPKDVKLSSVVPKGQASECK
ncbi:putative histone deacetylase 2 [Dissostichus eleginoides]|uniref:Histone deacetylase 2 n=1 Tax=Dissostichus eleginoides TaxID=100907 RepID=A0AAD9CM85_DISEL|nr:putative histone deacetylase 2 [Dissostichus eleginoides]